MACDDLKVSHKDDDEITKILLFWGKLYGYRITVNRGVVHDYLGMDLDFSTPGKLRVSMIKYLAKIFKAFPEKSGPRRRPQLPTTCLK